ncbi:MAG: hypothetical protein RB296_10220 [Acidobacteriota bacterium]|jgi:hypothetical protein|nr:hypothetical protein [Acidobacteriota bacterium]
MRRRTTLLLLAAIVAGAVALYLPTLKYEAIWDTRDFLANSILLTQDHPLLPGPREAPGNGDHLVPQGPGRAGPPTMARHGRQITGSGRK